MSAVHCRAGIYQVPRQLEHPAQMEMLAVALRALFRSQQPTKTQVFRGSAAPSCNAELAGPHALKRALVDWLSGAVEAGNRPLTAADKPVYDSRRTWRPLSAA